jgi:hypothetical protein
VVQSNKKKIILILTQRKRADAVHPQHNELCKNTCRDSFVVTIDDLVCIEAAGGSRLLEAVQV